MRSLAPALATIGLLAGASAAAADWSPPRPVTVPRFSTVAHAVNARGDTAVAWATAGTPAESPLFRTAVSVRLRSASGSARTVRLWSGRQAGARGIAVTLDARGEVTVLWATTARAQQTTVGGEGGVRAAYGTVSGRWASARLVGRGGDDLQAAVGRDGEVLATWVAGPAGAERVTAAWRRPGRAFAAARRLGRPAVSSTPYLARGAVPSFDAAGSAYVSGRCDAVVLRARPGGRAFRTILSRGPALGFGFSATGSGRGIASWVNGRCASDVGEGPATGPAVAAILGPRGFGTPIALPSTRQAGATQVLAARAGGGTATWSEIGPERIGVFGVAVGPSGALGAVRSFADGLIPFAADGGGDTVLARVFPGPPATFGRGGVAVRPAGGGGDQPSPAPEGGALAVSWPTGRRIAVLWTPAGRPGETAISVWRP